MLLPPPGTGLVQGGDHDVKRGFPECVKQKVFWEHPNLSGLIPFPWNGTAGDTGRFPFQELSGEGNFPPFRS